MISGSDEPLLGKIGNKVTAPARTLLIASGVLLLIGVVSLVFSKGRNMTVTTNVDAARVFVDGREGGSLGGPSWRFVRVPFGERQVTAAHRDYVTLVNPMEVTIFSAPEYTLTLERRQVRLALETAPQAEVFLDGERFGSADPGGKFSSDKVPAGDYTMTVRAAGYEEWQADVALHDDENTVRAALAMTPEKREEVIRLRERAFELVQQANSLFAARNYRAALSAIEESIRLNPDNPGAIQMRERIVETINILQ